MKQKTALITGASRGIGEAAARAFAADGWHLALNCREQKDRLENLCKELTAGHHIQCLPFTGDVSDQAFCADMFQKTADVLGGVDVLINNAGISYVGLLEQMKPEEWDRVIGTNLSAPFYCIRLALPYMLRQKRGCILNVSSVWGNTGASCEAAYSASKGGLNALTKALAKELAPSGIRVNAIACGAIDTEMNGHLSPDEKSALAAEIPAGRFGTPAEAASLLLQLAHGPDYLTGQVITLDGGWI